MPSWPWSGCSGSAGPPRWRPRTKCGCRKDLGRCADGHGLEGDDDLGVGKGPPLHGLAHLPARLEADGELGGDGDPLHGLGVLGDAGGTDARLENPELAELDAVALA